MAHWCFNKLAIHGDRVAVDDAVAGMRGSYADGRDCPFDFERVFPPPDPETVLNSWRYDNWGTDRYPIHCHVCSDEDAEFALEFDTASGPASGVVAALAAQHPHLRFVHLYDFDDYGYGGELTYEDGELVDEQQWEEEEEEEEEPEDEWSAPQVAQADTPTTRIVPGVRARPSALAEGGADSQ